MCMYVCIWCTCIRTDRYKYVCVFVCIDICICVYACIEVDLHTYTHVYTCIHLHAQTHTHAYIINVKKYKHSLISSAAWRWSSVRWHGERFASSTDSTPLQVRCVFAGLFSQRDARTHACTHARTHTPTPTQLPMPGSYLCVNCGM